MLLHVVSLCQRVGIPSVNVIHVNLIWWSFYITLPHPCKLSLVHGQNIMQNF